MCAPQAASGRSCQTNPRHNQHRHKHKLHAEVEAARHNSNNQINQSTDDYLSHFQSTRPHKHTHRQAHTAAHTTHYKSQTHNKRNYKRELSSERERERGERGRGRQVGDIEIAAVFRVPPQAATQRKWKHTRRIRNAKCECEALACSPRTFHQSIKQSIRQSPHHARILSKWFKSIARAKQHFR